MLISVQRFHRGAKLHGVGWLHDHNVRDRAQNTDILHAHVSAAVELGGDAGIGPDDLHILIGIADGDRDLVADAACGEGREGFDPGLEAIGGKTGSDAGHVLLGNTAVESLIGETLIQLLRAVGARKVGIKNNNMGVLFHHFRQTRGVNSSHFHGLFPLDHRNCGL